MIDDIETKLLGFIEEYLKCIPDLSQEKISKRGKYIKATIVKAFKDAGLEAPPIPDEVLELNHLLDTESDRGCVLAEAAFLETELSQLLRNVLVEDEKLLKDLFEVSGPLAIFSARIELAYGLGYLSPFERRDFKLDPKNQKQFCPSHGIHNI